MALTSLGGMEWASALWVRRWHSSTSTVGIAELLPVAVAGGGVGGGSLPPAPEAAPTRLPGIAVLHAARSEWQARLETAAVRALLTDCESLFRALTVVTRPSNHHLSHPIVRHVAGGGKRQLCHTCTAHFRASRALGSTRDPPRVWPARTARVLRLRAFGCSSKQGGGFSLTRNANSPATPPLNHGFRVSIPHAPVDGAIAGPSFPRSGRGEGGCAVGCVRPWRTTCATHLCRSFRVVGSPESMAAAGDYAADVKGPGRVASWCHHTDDALQPRCPVRKALRALRVIPRKFTARSPTRE